MSNLDDDCNEPISAPSRFHGRTGRGARHFTKRACTKRIISICLGLKRVLQVNGTIHFFTAEILVQENTDKNRLLISSAPGS